MTPLVSILIPVFNRETIIAETIESAMAQTHQNIEVILVDNASTDNTWKVIQDFAVKDNRIKAFRNATNLGPVRNWLRCVEEASGEYGKILWSDDLIAPEFIEKTLTLFNDDVGFVYTGANIFNGANPLEEKTSYLLKKSGLYPSTEYIQKAMFNKGMPVSPGCAIFRMDDIRKNLWLNIPNKVNSDFSMHAIGNDLLLFLLTANDYKRFGHVAEPLSFFRAHEGSISISATRGKLPLHYMLVKAYFAEHYRKDMVNKVSANALILLNVYPIYSMFGIHSINDFFKKPVKISPLSIFFVFLNLLARSLVKIATKINLRFGFKI